MQAGVICKQLVHPFHVLSFLSLFMPWSFHFLLNLKTFFQLSKSDRPETIVIEGIQSN